MPSALFCPFLPGLMWPLGAFWSLLRLLGASWGLLWLLLGICGAFCGFLVILWGLLGFIGASGGLQMPPEIGWGFLRPHGLSWGFLGPPCVSSGFLKSLGASWNLLGGLFEFLVASCLGLPGSLRGASWVSWGRMGALGPCGGSGPFSGFFGFRWFPGGFLGPPRPSWGLLGAYWGRSLGLLERICILPPEGMI